MGRVWVIVVVFYYFLGFFNSEASSIGIKCLGFISSYDYEKESVGILSDS